MNRMLQKFIQAFVDLLVLNRIEYAQDDVYFMNYMY